MFRIFNMFLIFLLLGSSQLLAQEQNPQSHRSDLVFYTLEGDTSVCVNLPDIIITPNGYGIAKKRKRPRRYRKGTRAYNRTIRNLKIVYPLAKRASAKLIAIETQMKNIKGEKARKKFVKKEYTKLMKIYKEPMKKLKISQGRMLILLIDRETGSTTFHHIKEYKGGFTAFFWQGIARLFGNNLKSTYDPYGKDIYLEALIQKYEKGQL